MRQLLKVCLAIFLLSLIGCGKIQEEVVEDPQPVAESVAEVVDVKLEDITKPVAGEYFCTLQLGCGYDVYYGAGYMNYLTVDSGLPGFGYPMCIVMEQFEQSDLAVIQTMYGTFTYKLEWCKEDFAESCINFGIANEQLYLYSVVEDVWYCYNYTDGPIIGE